MWLPSVYALANTTKRASVCFQPPLSILSLEYLQLQVSNVCHLIASLIYRSSHAK